VSWQNQQSPYSALCGTPLSYAQGLVDCMCNLCGMSCGGYQQCVTELQADVNSGCNNCLLVLSEDMETVCNNAYDTCAAN
jgi:hypothetical protein